MYDDEIYQDYFYVGASVYAICNSICRIPCSYGMVIEMKDDSRRLATIRVVDEILPITGADAIELARFGGWQCVIKKGELKAGDRAMYFEIDSMLPASDVRFAFLEKQGVKNVAGIRYYRLKTMRMRGQLSQGLALPASLFPEITDSTPDIDEALGIIKYDPDMGKVRQADAKGSFPSFIRKTDAERIQNISWYDLENWIANGVEFEVTVKLDGSSCTMYNRDGEVGVCSRNLELKIDQDNQFPNMLRQYGIVADSDWPIKNIAIQGELIGPRIQGNFEKVKENEFHVFNVWDIDAQKYLATTGVVNIAKQFKMNHVPIIADATTLVDFIGGFDGTENDFRAKLMSMADGHSINHDKREGIVFKSVDGSIIFKVISNSYLERKK